MRGMHRLCHVAQSQKEIDVNHLDWFRSLGSERNRVYFQGLKEAVQSLSCLCSWKTICRRQHRRSHLIQLYENMIEELIKCEISAEWCLPCCEIIGMKSFLTFPPPLCLPWPHNYMEWSPPFQSTATSPSTTLHFYQHTNMADHVISSAKNVTDTRCVHWGVREAAYSCKTLSLSPFLKGRSLSLVPLKSCCATCTMSSKDKCEKVILVWAIWP